MARKRMKVGTGECSALTRAQQDELEHIICAAMEGGAQIPWRKMIESASFANLTYDLLRREGKTVMRQLSKQRPGSIKRRVSDVDEAFAEPEPLDERVSELEALYARKDELVSDGGNQIKALKQQVKQLKAVIAEKDAFLAEEQKRQKQAESLQQCISELSAIIASKDALLAEANARYEALVEGIRQLASGE
ncbi:hypothetical protein PRNP1_008525 [Phytophthora ramorum]